MDLMNIVKNVVYYLYWYTTTIESDTFNVKNDLRDINIKHVLWISDRMKKIPAYLPWIISKEEVNMVHNVIKTIRTPNQYG